MEHFSLTEHDQLNLFGKQAQLAAGAERLEYHTTYCNAINMWIAGCQTAEEVDQIFYGGDVSEEYRSEVLQAYLLQIAAMAGKEGEEL